jgi:hypothetical protein
MSKLLAKRAVLWLGAFMLAASCGDEPGAAAPDLDAAAPRSDAGGAAGQTAAAGRGGSAAGRGGSAAGQSGAARGGGGAAGVKPASDGGVMPDEDAGPAATTFAGDTFLPWWGGPKYYEKWPRGLPADPAFFPIAVWLQTPSNAMRYKAVGVNLFVGLWEGPTNEQLSTLKTAGVPTVCDQAGVWSDHRDDTTVWGWLQPDEPDNAQPKASGSGYDPCIDPKVIVAAYDKLHMNDPSRPVWLGLGRGVSDAQWVGRGTCTGQTDMYKEYQKGGDILSFDIYPVNGGIGLEAVGKGVDNLRGWSDFKKPVVADIEASNIDNTTRPSPAQIKAEVWLALTHGAAGIQYFCHRFSPTFSETDCLDDKPTANALPGINHQVSELARVLNTPSVSNGVSFKSDDPVDLMLKRQGDVTYLFVVQIRNTSTKVMFQLERFPPAASAEVLGENRTLEVKNGIFADDFGAYAVHLYKISVR